MLRSLVTFLACVFMLACAPALAQEPTPEQRKAFDDKMAAIQAALKPQSGAIVLNGAKATLNLGEAYYFLGEKDARTVLVDGWGNPPSAADGVLGMIFKSGTDFRTEGAWGGVVTFEDSGYVTDDDAASTNFDEVLSQMREGEAQENAARQKQ